MSDPAELCAVARVLSLGFAPPDGEALAEIGALSRGLLARPGLAEETRTPLAELAAAAGEVGLAESLPREYAGLFDGEVRCPPYEGSYEADPFRQTRQMADVAGFYRAFGAEAAGPAAERPDHVGTELEFLSFLVARRLAAEAEGLAEQAEVCREAEEAFLRDHLGRWLGALCRKVEEAEPAAFYAALARLGGRFVAAELAQRGIEPAPLPERRRWSVEADSFDCGADKSRA